MTDDRADTEADDHVERREHGGTPDLPDHHTVAELDADRRATDDTRQRDTHDGQQHADE